ncbi:hypothetical protein CLU94_5496 [Janthinobacterium sp. 13]|nr:hypothetical protein CLU94_5496 [Janthinobacterium sp. 13]
MPKFWAMRARSIEKRQQSATSGRWAHAIRRGDLHQKTPIMNVLEMAEMAVTASNDDPEGSCLTVAEVMSRLNTHDSNNAHLADPAVDRSRFRSEVLRGDEPVHGEFLALVYSAHYPLVRLDGFADFRAMEEWLASDSGIVNSFATYVIAFIAGQSRSYAIAYKAADGTVQEFDKWAQNLLGPQPAENVSNRWVAWKCS